MFKKSTDFNLTKKACYYSYLSMSSAFSLPPILFLTFRELYGISFTLLGTLVLINFCTQLCVDLAFTFFTKFFNVKKCVQIMPLITSLGLFVYALVPTFFPEFAYVGLVIGTVIFSVAAGLSECLLSPTVAAIPSDNPGKDMSLLHSLYAWGVVSVVIISTVFLTIFGNENWMYLTIFWAIAPVLAFVLFSIAPMPDMDISHNHSADTAKKKNFALALCFFCIFFGSAAENAMTNWISGFMETALNIPKTWCDVSGMALFAILLGVVRTLYAKYGKNIYSVLLFGMFGAVICYLVAGFSSNAIVSTVACVLTGICTSMLWPGTLIFMEEVIKSPGVTAYALLAAGGDFGASVAPQMLGAVVDAVSVSDWAVSLGQTLSLTGEQIGMKVGMLTASIFPMIGFILLLFMGRYFKKKIFVKKSV